MAVRTANFVTTYFNLQHPPVPPANPTKPKWNMRTCLCACWPGLTERQNLPPAKKVVTVWGSVPQVALQRPQQVLSHSGAKHQQGTEKGVCQRVNETWDLKLWQEGCDETQTHRKWGFPGSSIDRIICNRWVSFILTIYIA